jgi:uncharacterized membrane protein YkoI
MGHIFLENVMNRYIIPPAVAAVLLASFSSWALAVDDHTGPSSNMSSTHITQVELGAPPKTDIRPFRGAKLSLTDAIHAAQQQHKGDALEVKFEMWDGQPAYFIRASQNHEIWEARINANSGQLIGQPRTFTSHQITHALEQRANAVSRTHTSLAQAVQNAEQQRGGKAIMAKVQIDSSGQADFDVDVVKNGQLQVAQVDASTGKVG